MIHQLICKKEAFESIARGDKPFLVWPDNISFAKGDYIGLNETTEDLGLGGERYDYATGRCMLLELTYVSSHPDYCKEGMVILGVSPCDIVTSSRPCSVFGGEVG